MDPAELVDGQLSSSAGLSSDETDTLCTSDILKSASVGAVRTRSMRAKAAGPLLEGTSRMSSASGLRGSRSPRRSVYEPACIRGVVSPSVAGNFGVGAERAESG